jgi:hypothetical protein
VKDEPMAAVPEWRDCDTNSVLAFRIDPTLSYKQAHTEAVSASPTFNRERMKPPRWPSAAHAGRATSRAKAAAARRNAKKGGWRAAQPGV